MILHDVKNEDGIKNFFNEVYETFIKVSLDKLSDKWTLKIMCPKYV